MLWERLNVSTLWSRRVRDLSSLRLLWRPQFFRQPLRQNHMGGSGSEIWVHRFFQRELLNIFEIAQSQRDSLMAISNQSKPVNPLESFSLSAPTPPTRSIARALGIKSNGASFSKRALNPHAAPSGSP